jgi:hypothetical protein
MNELRRSLLDESDAPPELSPDLRFLAAREGALGGLVLDHLERYRLLMERRQEEGTTPELQANARDAAGNLGTILQSMRSRQDLVDVLGHVPKRPGVPLWLIDQLFFCFVLLSEPCTEEEAESLIPGEEIEPLFFASERMRDWLATLGAVPPRDTRAQPPRWR